MLNILEAAILSQHIYQPKHSLFAKQLQTTLTQQQTNNRNCHGWYRLIDVEPDIHPSQPFFAQLYIKFHCNRPMVAAMAIRGTTYSADNLCADVRSWWSSFMGDGANDKAPDYMAAAVQFYHDAQHYMRSFFPKLSRLYITGHSLGGALAKLLVLQGFTPNPVIAFNPPNCRHMDHVLTQRAHWLCNVDARYGLINKIGGQPLGQTHWVEIPERNHEAKQLLHAWHGQSYQRSQQYYHQSEHDSWFWDQCADAIWGLKARLHSLQQANELVAHFPETQKALQQCQEHSDNAMLATFFQSGQAIIQKSCEQETMLQQYAAIIGAQHSIANMVQTLQSKPYLSLAQQTV